MTPTPDAVNDTLTINEDSGATAINPLANDDTGAGTDGVDDVTITTAPLAAQGTLTYTAGRHRQHHHRLQRRDPLRG